MQTASQATTALERSGSFYSDPLMVARADGYYDGAEGRGDQGFDYPGVVIGEGRHLTASVRSSYTSGYAEGARRRAKVTRRGW